MCLPLCLSSPPPPPSLPPSLPKINTRMLGRGVFKNEGEGNVDLRLGGGAEVKKSAGRSAPLSRETTGPYAKDRCRNLVFHITSAFFFTASLNLLSSRLGEFDRDVEREKILLLYLFFLSSSTEGFCVNSQMGMSVCICPLVIPQSPLHPPTHPPTYSTERWRVHLQARPQKKSQSPVNQEKELLRPRPTESQPPKAGSH